MHIHSWNTVLNFPFGFNPNDKINKIIDVEIRGLFAPFQKQLSRNLADSLADIRK